MIIHQINTHVPWFSFKYRKRVKNYSFKVPKQRVTTLPTFNFKHQKKVIQKEVAPAKMGCT
jgi:hypothetical protein